MSGRMDRRGFTLVEAIKMAVVIAVILAVLIPIMRERERQRIYTLQVLADAEPWEVFEFRAKPTKESFTERERIVIECEITNLTDSPLTLPKNLGRFRFILGSTNQIAGVQAGHTYARPETAIAPGESVSFEWRVFPVGVGAAEVRVVNLNRALRFDTRSRTFRGFFPGAGKRFQSNLFRLVVEASDGSKYRTIEESFIEIKK